MLALSINDIKVGVELADKNAVIHALAHWLEEDGHVASGYQAGMMAREAKAATYLGQGIAIPHGTQACRHLIQNTGIKVLHLPQGVEWGDGEKAYLVLGIAARSDEHLDLLKQLAKTLSQDNLQKRVMAITEPEQVLALLQDPAEPKEVGLPLVHIATELDAETLLQLTDHALELVSCSTQEQAQLRQAAPIHIGQGWWLSQTNACHGPSQAALVTANVHSPLLMQTPAVRGVLVLFVKGVGHKALLDQLLAWLAVKQGAALAALHSATALLDALEAGPAAYAQQRHSTEQIAVVRNTHGIHARPGAILVQIAKQFEAEVQVRNLEGDGQWMSAKSLMQMISLGAKRGHQLLFSASGADSEAAVSALVNGVKEGLGEALGEDLVEDVLAPEQATHEIQSQDEAQTKPITLEPNTELTGVAAAAGVAIGPVFVDVAVQFDYPQQGEDTVTEKAALAAAIEQACHDLSKAQAHSHDPQASDIIAMHQELLADPALSFGVNCRISQGQSAPAAWWSEINLAATRQANNKDALLAERAADIRDVGRRVMAILCDSPASIPPEHPYIWVAQEIGPSQLVNLDPQQVLGIVTVSGGAASHSAILAAALGIPALAGVNGAVMTIKNATHAILDGNRGCLTIAPDASIRQQAQAQQRQAKQAAARAWEERDLAAITQDKHRIDVAANLGGIKDASQVLASGGDGVGLLRTEFVFMSRRSAPDLASQTALYRPLFDALKGRPLLARTLDVGGDKPLPYWSSPKEDNPFLGVRGIRLCQQHPALLKTQIRALLMAANNRPVRIMFPMITDIAEWRWAKDRVNEIQAELNATQVELGIMIEVPAAALCAPVFAQEVDFFSIGTNDLTQYTMAVDRGNGELAYLGDGLHPSVLQLIKMTVEAAHQQGKWVGVCGELAADAQAVPILLGLGVDELSVSLARLPLVKSQIRQLSFAHCQWLAQQALVADDAAGVRRLMSQAEKGIAPDKEPG
ncbi:phosphoenolpyruvate--protein phosphotransferase [Oceanisphaera pacifica]|uniref:Multiphosphoryl transfer protein n=1 Tax=Oceanisphaera pacifica TaxID=2818389 RepID=A0ABS3NI16_9GAMM|nr:phosphoenolpyruvate--protein phosphotransferase [Oceanisphaera pacifica]MBO1520234.1 phosphoenolpyruvate--protein phosphotransferase [Oceanisphaera pacifica]